MKEKFPISNFQFSIFLRGLPRKSALATQQRGSFREQVSYVRGQSLFEVVFAVGIAALILVGITSLSATSVRNSSFSKNNAGATKYAQEASEWLREQRDTNWNSFYAQASGSTKNLGTLSWPPGGSCNIPPDNFFCRKVTLSIVPLTTNTIEAVVEVERSDEQGLHSARTITRYTNWR